MKICFLILAHDHPRLCGRLIRGLAEQGDLVAVHLDAKAPADIQVALNEDIGDLREQLLWADRVSVSWGEWSMVQATLNGLEAIRRAPDQPDYVYLLSGADYPIRPLAQLHSFLERHRGSEFIESVDAERERWVAKGMQQERYRYRHWFSWKKHPRLHELSTRIQQRLGLQRPFPAGLHPHMGSQWWALTWSSCEAILERSRDRRLTGFFRRTWVPDELYFQTLVRSIVQDPERIDGRHLTLYEFTDDGAPLVYYDDHDAYLMKQPYFFARKLSPLASRLRRRLDAALSDPALQPPPQDQRVGDPPHDYRQFIEVQAGPVTGRRSMLRVEDPARGDLEWNALPYFVLVADSPATLRQAQKVADEQPGIRCHGELMGRARIGFAGDIARYAGYGADDVRIRDQKPQNFLVDLLRESPRELTGYLWNSAADTEHLGVDLLGLHAADSNAHLIHLQGEAADVGQQVRSALGRIPRPPAEQPS